MMAEKLKMDEIKVFAVSHDSVKGKAVEELCDKFRTTLEELNAGLSLGTTALMHVILEGMDAFAIDKVTAKKLLCEMIDKSSLIDTTEH